MNSPNIKSSSAAVSAIVHNAVAVTAANTGLTGSLDLNTIKPSGEIMFLAFCTASTSPTSLTLKIQDSADNTTFADVAGAPVSAAFSGTPNNTCVTVGAGFWNCRRYVRLASSAISGTSFTISAYVVYGKSGNLPA